MNRLNRDNNDFFQLDDNEMNIKELIAINYFYFPDNTETQKVEIFPNQDTFYYLDEYFGEGMIDVDNKVIDLKLDSIADVIFKMGNYINTYLVIETAGIPDGVTLHLLDENYNQLYSPFTTDGIYSKTACNITVGEVDAIVLPAKYISETNWIDLTAGIYNWYLKFDGDNKYDEKIIPIIIEIRDFETTMAMPFVIEENDDLALKIRNYADEIPLALINEGLINEEGILTYENKLIGTDSGNNNLLIPLSEPNSRVNYFVNEPTITLESSEDVLCSYNGLDSCILFATVLNQREEPIINGKVDFFKDNNYIGSAKTSENGIAYIEYETQEPENIDFTAKYKNIESEKINVINLFYYNDGSSTDSLGIQEGVSCTSDGEYITITTDTDGEKYVAIPVPILSSDIWEISFITKRTSSGDGKFSFKIIDETEYVHWKPRNYNFYMEESDAHGISYSHVGTNSIGWTTGNKSYIKDGDKITIQKKGTSWSIYVNNSKKESFDSLSWTGAKRLAFYTNNGKIQILKDITVKPLKADASIKLSGDKTTFVSGDEITLTATLLDINGEPIPDEGIIFYNGSTELGTVVTDENGVSIFPYTPNDIEDLNFTAIMETGDITSNEYNVEGYFFSDRAKDTNHTEEWINYNDILSVLRDSSGTYLKNETENNGYYIATQNQLESFVMEFKATVIEGDSYISYDSENGEIRLDTRINPGDNIKLVYKNNKTHIFINDEYITYLETETLTDISLMLLPSSKLKFSNFIIKKFKNTPKDIVLTTDKDTISFIDEETCTLSATVFNEITEGVPNQTVEFYNEETFMGTGITNEDGIATITYRGYGDGITSFTAKINKMTSNTIEIEDILYFNSMSSSNGISSFTKKAYQSHTGADLLYDSTENAWKINGTDTSSHYDIYYSDETIDLRNTIVEYEMKAPYQYGLMSGFAISNPDNYHALFFASMGEANSNRTYVAETVREFTAFNTQRTFIEYRNNSNIRWDTWCKFRIKFYENRIEYYFVKENGDEVLTTSITNTTNILNEMNNIHFGFSSAKQAQYAFIRNLKIKSMYKPASIIITSTKNILSYYDNDECILSATVLDENNNIVGNKTVEFFRGNTSIGLSNFDEANSPTKIYESKNKGKVSFIAKYKNIVSNSYGIEDILYYDDASTNNISRYANYNIQATADMTFDETNGYLMSGVGNKTTGYGLPVQAKHIKAKMYSNENGMGLITISDGDTVLCVKNGSIVWKYIDHTWNSNNRPSISNFPSSESRQKWFTLEVEIINDIAYCTLEQDGNTYFGNFSLNGYLDYANAYVGLGCASVSSNTAYVKEIRAYNPKGIKLSSDKNVLSYIDEDSCTLTAVITDSNDNLLSNQRVEFFKNDISIGTATTNEYGVATKPYSSIGAGDVTFKASIEEMVSKTYEVCDALIYVPEEISPTASYSNYLSRILSDFSFDGSIDYEVEMDFKISAGGGGFSIAPINDATYKKHIAFGYNSNQITAYWGKNDISGEDKQRHNQSLTWNTFHHWKITKIGSEFNWDRNNGADTFSTTASWLGTYGAMGLYFYKWESPSMVVKNIKIKKLPYNLKLTSDKSIISSYDSDSCTLTATVLDYNNQPVENATVEFWNGSTSMGTEQTNSSGIATKTYSATGVGDVTFKATVGEIVSEIYEVQDLYYFDSGATDKTINYDSSIPLRRSGTSTWTYDSNEYYVSTVTTNWSESFIPIRVLEGLTDDFSIEFDSYITGSMGSSGIIIYNDDNNWYKLSDDGNNQYWVAYSLNGNFTEVKKTPGTTVQKWIHSKYTVENGVFNVELSENDVVIANYSIQLSNFSIGSSTKYGIDVEWNGNTQTRYKNIKIKKL